MLEKKFDEHSFTDVNDVLKLFRGLAFGNILQDERANVFNIYRDYIKKNEKKLIPSTWMTVIETCRYSQNLEDMLEYAKKKFEELIDLDSL